jgi:hypothetical protein
MRTILPLILLVSIGTSCNLSKEVDIRLPDFDGMPVVECYLEPGRPYRLLLTNAFAYFDQFDIDNPLALLLQGASVRIHHAGQTIQLDNQLYLDPEFLQVANYGSSELVPEDYGQDFELEIILPDGGVLMSRTRLLPVVPFDSLVVEFNPNTNLARVLTYFTDDTTQTNYYRRMVNFGSLDSLPIQDFAPDDAIFVDGRGAFGVGFNFETGDTLIHTLFHIDRAYWRFFNTLNQSIFANLNPFGQPGLIETNIEGSIPATGIFTGLSYARDTVIIP